MSESFSKTVKSIATAYQSMYEEKDHIEHEDSSTRVYDDPRLNKAHLQDHLRKVGGPSIKITSYTHHGSSGGNPDFKVKGHVKHVMKFINHHMATSNDRSDFSTDHAGHKAYKKYMGYK